jgi:hypothetical protein
MGKVKEGKTDSAPPEESSKDPEPVEEKASPEETSVVIEKKEKSNLGSRLKNWLILFLLLIIVVSVGLLLLWRGGVNDLKNDRTILVVVQEKGVAKAGSIYDLTTNEAESINVGSLRSLEDLDLFFKEASSQKRLDRLVVVRVETINKLSTEPALEYHGVKIPTRDVGGYITGDLDEDLGLAGGDPSWKFRSNLLSEWLEFYDKSIFEAKFGSHVYNTLFADYRGGSITVYPKNTALILIRYVPIEQIFL